MHRNLIICLVFLLTIPFVTLAENTIDYHRHIRWNGINFSPLPGNQPIHSLSFSGSVPSSAHDMLPLFSESIEMDGWKHEISQVSIITCTFEPLDEKESLGIRDASVIPEKIQAEWSVEYYRKQPRLMISFLPLFQSERKIFKVTSFDIQIVFSDLLSSKPLSPSRTYADHSVLASGNWYKIGVTQSALYKITYSDLVSIGIDPSIINPAHIRIYGNGGGMLPEANSATRYDDLIENVIFVAGQEDGVFHPDDYILFYGRSPDTWQYDDNTNTFLHSKNLYSEQSFYFITTDLGAGKRVTDEASSTQPVTQYINKFNDFAFYEPDQVNLIKSGRIWYDQDVFDVSPTKTYAFNFSDIETNAVATLRADVAARSTYGKTGFAISVNNNQLMNFQVPSTTSYYLDPYAKTKTEFETFGPNAANLNVKVVFTKFNSSDLGWMNYLEMNVMRKLIFRGGQLGFRSVQSVGNNNISQFMFTESSSSMKVWDVSDPENVRNIILQGSGQDRTFTLPTETLREFIAFDGNSFPSVQFIGRVDNQDLHGINGIDMVIVSYPDFLQSAERLADHHRQQNDYSVLVTIPQMIYHEFSSGRQDVTAIRDFMKMLYDRSSTGGTIIKYLTLFGDASYDYHSRVSNNTNFVPTYESVQSLDPIDSYATDDYFGILDDNEGQNCAGILDIGIGRFPVVNALEAEAMVDKIIHYSINQPVVMDDWRNIICFVADDENNHMHENQSEKLAIFMDTTYRQYNVDKIYIDAYPQISTPGGQRYPDVNLAINNRVDKGAFIINYIGHGGEVGWAHERILEIADINSWRNFDKMPLFITATCEFSRYDDPGRTSAGELVFLNQKGGGIALLTTTRPTYSGANYSLSEKFYQKAFEMNGDTHYTLGDLIASSKTGTSSDANARKFILLGDPAMTLAYPVHKAVTSYIGKVQTKSVTTTGDTLKALSAVNISGEIRDKDDQLQSDFNGAIYPTVFDKVSEITTLDNDEEGSISFTLRKNIIYKGQAEVNNGLFSFTFIVPKDIEYKYGQGKISYYSHNNENSDASGYDLDIIIGGYDNTSIIDTVGPLVNLYINDESFRFGGLTHENPVILATIMDESGINTVGNGIGHDIVLVLDHNTTESKVINDSYVSDMGTYKSGIISYPLFSVPEGRHHVQLKVWDVFNNSTTAYTEFIVANSSTLALEKLLTCPNPFSTSTTFRFEHNQSGEAMDVKIRIFNMSGSLIRTLDSHIPSGGSHIEPITWNGTDEQGNTIGSGLYVYQVELDDAKGNQAAKSSRLVFIK